jgi:hypothetical protein
VGSGSTEKCIRKVEKNLVLRTPDGCWLQCDKRQVLIGSNVVDGADLPERRRFNAEELSGNRSDFVEMQR